MTCNQPSDRPHLLPNQRWHIAAVNSDLVAQLARELGISPVVAQVVATREFMAEVDISEHQRLVEAARVFLHPEQMALPEPEEEFADLALSVGLLEEAIARGDAIAICGDYDADGMTSTALLLRALRWLGATVSYAIPSRMQEGYGINRRIVEEFHQEGVKLVLTVDNGIAAYEPIARARELGLTVILTDHHDLPPQLPPAQAILNPKLLDITSPYRGVAGVGVAYLLARSLARNLGQLEAIADALLALLALGTIADLAPLVGINRYWVQRGLQALPHARVAGIQALIQVSGVEAKGKALKPEDIGFRLGPRINAVGRIDDPQVAISLLTTDDPAEALERATQCEGINQRRQELCACIEQEAIAWIEASDIDLQQQRVLVVVQPDWHHGTIGIVASRLVERYGVPVFIGTYEDEAGEHLRGSARGIPEFHVFQALQYCDDLLTKYGGHRAAGGFSLPATHLDTFQQRLSQFAWNCLEPHHLKPLVRIDAIATFADIGTLLYQQLQAIEPCGIGNPPPVFWTPEVRVVDQRIVGSGHIKATLEQRGCQLKAIAWRWQPYFPLPPQVDVAYRLKENTWNGTTTIELELVGARLPEVNPALHRTLPDLSLQSPRLYENPPNGSFQHANQSRPAHFTHAGRSYTCCLFATSDSAELRIWNDRGECLTVKKGERMGVLGKERQGVKRVNVCQPPLRSLVVEARRALNI